MSRKRKAAKVLSGRFTAMPHYILDCPAYKALPPLARCVYWHLHRLAGFSGEKNGEVFYSVRNAADDHGVANNTANRAFDDLQAKGFIVPERIGHLGIEGQGKATTWRLTTFPIVAGRLPSKDFEKWSEGNDFPVAKKQKPVSTIKTPIAKPSQPLRQAAPKSRKSSDPCLKNCDVLGNSGREPVAVIETYREIPSGRASPVVRLVKGGRDG
jgi:hypothetical protein